MDSPDSDSSLNALLRGLPRAAWDYMRCYLSPVYLPVGKVLYEPGTRPDSVHFPTTAIVSLQCELANGTSTEMAVVGNEGMVGIALFMGGDTTSSRAVVDSPGEAYRLQAQILKQELDRWGAMQNRILLYMQALITQVAQTAACNRHHSVEQQTCRWLAGRLDRQQSSGLIVTHELIAARLGVRRESVTAAAANLQHAGLIRYQRGHILVLDRAGLEAHCCECYTVLKRETDRLSHLPTRFTDMSAPMRAAHPRARPRVELHAHAGIA